MDRDIIAKIQKEIDLGNSDTRLRFILNWAKSGKPLFETDKRYLADVFAHAAQSEYEPPARKEKSLTNYVNQRDELIAEDIRRETKSRQNFQGREYVPRTESSSYEAPIHLVEAIVEMRKNMHQMLLKLDQLEESCRKEVQYKETRHEVKEYQKPTIKSETVIKTPEKNEIKDVRNKDIQKVWMGLRSLVVVLFVVTVFTAGPLIIGLTLLSTPIANEKLQEIGLTYDQIKPILNELESFTLLCIGAWLPILAIYLKKKETKQDIKQN